MIKGKEENVLLTYNWCELSEKSQINEKVLVFSFLTKQPRTALKEITIKGVLKDLRNAAPAEKQTEMY